MHNPYELEQSGLVLRDVVHASSLPANVTLRPRNGVSSLNGTLAASSSALSKTTSKHAMKHEDDSEREGLGVEEALARLFPPTEAGLDSDGNMKASVASTGYIDRMTVIHLQDSIDKRVKELEARPIGVDPIREGIYADALNEIIRQVAVLCPERGMLLAELRDEVQETNDTYDLLFDSACQYATRKGIERDLKRTMQKQQNELTSEVRRLENRVHELRAKYDGIDKRFNEQRAAEEKVHQEEVQFLKKGNLQLTTEIKRLTA